MKIKTRRSSMEIDVRDGFDNFDIITIKNTLWNIINARIDVNGKVTVKVVVKRR